VTGLGPGLGDRLPTTRESGRSRPHRRELGGAKDHEIDMNPVYAIDQLVVCRWKESRMRQARQGPRAPR
jgi:hypothetical protein